MYDFTIVGGGIIGLSVAMALTERFPNAKLLLLEKEDRLAAHQTGRNSGVIHSGIYYKPGSFKARFAREGNRSMVRFCREHGIEHELCGKVIVATEPAELPLLNTLYERGIANGLRVERLTPEQLREREPHAAGLAALHVPDAGIVDYKRVAATYADLLRQRGAELRTGIRVEKIHDERDGVEVETPRGSFRTRWLVNCAGLHSDRIARMAGVATGMRIVPFRGEYYELVPERRSLVRDLIYPVPNPEFPFLGVHFTRMIGGDVHAGPNAVLAWKREGYRKRDVSLRDLGEVLRYPAFWSLASANLREGAKEVIRSFSKAAFVRSLQKLIPEVRAEDLVPSTAGVRAQALAPNGKLVDDFHIVNGRRSVHVCNAPSPAATASLEIGREVVERIAALHAPTVSVGPGAPTHT